MLLIHFSDTITINVFCNKNNTDDGDSNGDNACDNNGFIRKL